MREFIARLRDLLRRDRLDAELKEELRFHREQLERDADATAGDAAVHASRRLGNATAIREEARDHWSLPWLDLLQQDLRYALRGLRRSPGFTAAVVLTLGLGIGANAAMFNVLDQLMFRPYPYLRDPATAHRVYLRMEGRESLLDREEFPYTRYLDLANWTTSFSQTAAVHQATLAIGVGDAARERPVEAVSASFFDFFDARPAAGRFFVPAEDTVPVGAPVVVLSYAFWQAEFGGRDVTGQSMQVGDLQCTIIGVAPLGFVGVADGSAPVLWMPITTFGGGATHDYWLRYNWDWTEMIVRRKPGIPEAQANADLTRAFARSRDAARTLHAWMPRVDKTRPIAIAGSMRSAAGPYPGLEARTLTWVSGVAVVVLLIACANVANLMLARALRRRREIALRVALGVTWRRLAAQFLTESVVLAILGAVAGIAIAQWGGASLRGFFLPADAAVDVVTDWRTLALAGAAAIGVGLITGLAPLLFAGKSDLTSTLKSGAREGTYHRSRLRSALLVWQGALSVALLIGAGLFVRSLGRVREMRLGYDVDPVVMVKWERRAARSSAAEQAAVQQRLLETAQAIPGVEHAAWTDVVPMEGTSTIPLFVAGLDSVNKLGRFTYQVVGPDYFRTIDTRILRGRQFTDQDRAGTPRVMVVSEGMASVLWPGEEALGRCIRVGADTMPCTEVIGIAENAVHDPSRDQPLRYYLPLDQFEKNGGRLLLLRAHGDPAAMSETARRRLQALMPGQEYLTAQPLAVLVQEQRRSWQIGAAMFVAFGVLALIVAAVGLYGVIAYNVAQRMHELGVRVALGAQGSDVARLVVGEGVRLGAAGVVVGCALALAAARWVQPLLFHESARDPIVFAAVAALLLAVALAASSVPAVRAMRADPNTVLRAE